MDFLASNGWLAHWRLHVLTVLLPQGLWASHHAEITTAIAALFVGIVVGITGMGGGALMTPALIFLGVGNVSSIITADLTAAAIYKSGGAAVHWRCGSPNLRLAALLICSSVPMAFLGPHLVRWITPGANIDTFLLGCIGIATLLAATTYAWRLFAQLRRSGNSRPHTSSNCVVRPLPTLLVGALGGLLVGVTSVGSGSLIMITLLMLYPALPAVQLVGTDLMQAVPFGSGIQHSCQRARLENCSSAHPRLGSWLHVWRKDRATNARLLYPPRNCRCPRHVRFSAA